MDIREQIKELRSDMRNGIADTMESLLAELDAAHATGAKTAVRLAEIIRRNELLEKVLEAAAMLSKLEGMGIDKSRHWSELDDAIAACDE